MFRLGLRLAVQGGRETIVRLIVTALAVMVGTALLFSVLATFRGYQSADAKPCFQISDGECTPGSEVHGDKAVLALHRKDAYKGESIIRLDLAKLSDFTVSIPGIPRMPQAGEYYASPAMAALLRQAPADELADRYPGRMVGTIGEAGLHSPDELVVVVGRQLKDISSMPSVVRIASVSPRQTTDSGATFMQFIAMLGAAALLFPILILVGSATRLGAARREERYAAFRLVGATPRQVAAIASADAALGAALGTIAGIALFFALQPFLADLAITGSRAFASDIRPATWQLILVAAGVPLSAVAAAVISLRRVNISPLGVSRKATRSTPRAIGLLPLVLGAVIFTVAILMAPSDEPPFTAVPGLLLIMVGLVTSGPWLTMHAVQAIAKFVPGAAVLLATRRLTDNPKAAFRAVSGLVLVVCTASITAFMTPALLTQNLSTQNNVLSNVLTVEFFPGKPLQPDESKQLLRQLQAMPSIQAFPIYDDLETATEAPDPLGPPDKTIVGPSPVIFGCDSLEQLRLLGKCPAGVQAITTDFETYEDVVLNHQIHSIITKQSQPRSIDADSLPLKGLLVRADTAATLEKARTILSQQVVTPVGEVLLTFGETRKAAVAAEAKMQAFIAGALAVALITAGGSVAVAVAGGMIERRRPFTLLRLSGASPGTLYKVVLWEAAIPLIGATVIAAAIGFGAAALVITQLAPDSANAHIAMPDLPYLLALVAGPAVALAVVSATLPLVGRLTKPDTVRFE